jgi:hypothetical protein
MGDEIKRLENRFNVAFSQSSSEAALSLLLSIAVSTSYKKSRSQTRTLKPWQKILVLDNAL